MSDVEYLGIYLINEHKIMPLLTTLQANILRPQSIQQRLQHAPQRPSIIYTALGA